MLTKLALIAYIHCKKSSARASGTTGDDMIPVERAVVAAAGVAVAPAFAQSATITESASASPYPAACPMTHNI
jgi:hypothetical protein